MPAGNVEGWEPLGGRGGWWRAWKNQVRLTVAGEGLEVTISTQARLLREVLCPGSFFQAEGLHQGLGQLRAWHPGLGDEMGPISKPIKVELGVLLQGGWGNGVAGLSLTV